jgi:glyoxylase-like metal-dependent hydrolase (beta-lactamase superfamily II)
MYRIINTGKFYADGGAMFGAVPKVSWVRCYPANERNLCVLAMNTGVVTTACGRTVVIDPGVGGDCLKSSPAIYYMFHEMTDIREQLRQEATVEPEAVTDVVFTHLHFDHVGGAVSDGKPVFPNATHWVSRRQYETERQPHPLEKDSFLPANTSVLEDAGLIQLIDNDVEVSDNFHLKLYDGHTYGQTVAFIRSRVEANAAGVDTSAAAEERLLVFPGDVVPLSSHVVPERISAYDLNPSLSWYSKIDVIERTVSEGAIMVFYHDVYIPAARVKRVGRSFKTLSF